MVSYASREEMLTAYGPFSAVFEPIDGNRNPYLCLLGLRDKRCENVIRVIREIADSDGSDVYTVVLLRDINWRPHLVATIATYFSRADSAITQCWRALDAGSWVTPQLVAVLSLIDQFFYENAITRLAAGCRVSDDRDYAIESAIERHSAQGPAGFRSRSAKAASSFRTILSMDHPHDQRVREMADDVELQRLIDDDIDDGGGIALAWRADFTGLIGLEC